MKWEKLELSEEDKAFREALEQNTREIISAFGMTPAMVGKHRPFNQEEYYNAIRSILWELVDAKRKSY